MVTVEWINGSVRLQVVPGERLLDALDERPQTGVVFSCRSGHCGTCRVRLVDGEGLVQPMQDAERETLHKMGAATGERLACQLRIDAPTGRLRLESVLPGDR